MTGLELPAECRITAQSAENEEEARRGIQKRTGGVDVQSLTASTVFQVLDALLSSEPKLVHSPGVLGYPGGNPILPSRNSCEFSLLVGMLLEAAVEINRLCQQADGVEAIESRRLGSLQFDAVRTELQEAGFATVDSYADGQPSPVTAGFCLHRAETAA